MEAWNQLEPGDRGPARLADLLFALAREVEPHGRRGVDVMALSRVESTVLRWIDICPGTSPSATAEATGLLRSNLSAALRGLEAKGMVTRTQDPDDHRLVRLYLTETARQNRERLHRHWAGLVTEALGGDLDGLDEAIALLARLDEGFRKLSK